jgi:hypothetical protein
MTNTKTIARWPTSPGISHLLAGLSSFPVSFDHSFPNSLGWNHNNPDAVCIIHATNTAYKLMSVK